LCHSSILSTSGMGILPSKRSTYVHTGVPRGVSDEPCQDELAMVQDNVSSFIIGEMRMQFWRDAVKSLADVRRPFIHYFTGREHDIGQTSASPHRSSST